MEYWKLKYLAPGKRRRAIGNLKSLRRFLDVQLPKRTAQGTLVLGTWNIRTIDNNRFGNGPRLEETFLYIAEVISRFDAIAIQEICRDLRPLDRLMSILGDEYRFILTDVTEGSSGNEESLGFIYNRDKASKSRMLTSVGSRRSSPWPAFWPDVPPGKTRPTFWSVTSTLKNSAMPLPMPWSRPNSPSCATGRAATATKPNFTIRSPFGLVRAK